MYFDTSMNTFVKACFYDIPARNSKFRHAYHICTVESPTPFLHASIGQTSEGDLRGNPLLGKHPMYCISWGQYVAISMQISLDKGQNCELCLSALGWLPRTLRYSRDHDFSARRLLRPTNATWAHDPSGYLMGKSRKQQRKE